MTYCYNVTNIGEVPLTNVNVADNSYGGVTLDDTTLASGESTTGILTHTVVEGDAPEKTNIATATGTPPVGQDVTDTDDCSIIVTG